MKKTKILDNKENSKRVKAIKNVSEVLELADKINGNLRLIGVDEQQAMLAFGLILIDYIRALDKSGNVDNFVKCLNYLTDNHCHNASEVTQ